MNTINWTQIGVFAAIVLVVFLIGITLLPFLFGGWGMMGPAMMGSGSSEGLCPFCGGTGRSTGGFFGGIFGWVSILTGMLLPLGLLVLVILGIVWLVRAGSQPPSGTPPAPRACRKCGKPVAVDWRVCPFCEEDLLRLE
jgi:hypothetical protein